MKRQDKYLYFIDICTALDDTERHVFETRYPDEVHAMSSFAEERFTERGLKRGLRQRVATVLICELERKFGFLAEAQRGRIETADAETLLSWCDRFPVAQSPDDVLR